MKPFDYELAKQKGVKLCTADGRTARIVCDDIKGSPYVMLVMVETNDKDREVPCYYTKKFGSLVNSLETDYDLQILSEPRYLNVFRKDSGTYYTTGKLYESEDLAKSLETNEKGTYVKTIKIEI